MLDDLDPAQTEPVQTDNRPRPEDGPGPAPELQLPGSVPEGLE